MRKCANIDLQLLHSEFPYTVYKENLVFFFISVDRKDSALCFKGFGGGSTLKLTGNRYFLYVKLITKVKGDCFQ
jgi:hypothetical protein